MMTREIKPELLDDLLSAARELADREGKTIDAVISELVRRSLTLSPPTGAHEDSSLFRRGADGIPQLPVTNPHAAVTSESVRALHDEAP